MPVRSFPEAHLLELKLPVPDLPEAKAIIEAFATAKDYERFLIYSMFNEQFDNERDIPTHPTMANLSAELRSLVRAYCARVEPRAALSDRPLRKFPTKDYALQLLRAGRLVARGLTADDWGGLEIEVGGLHNRLCVWRTFPPRSDINGDIESVGVRRTEVLKEFRPIRLRENRLLSKPQMMRRAVSFARQWPQTMVSSRRGRALKLYSVSCPVSKRRAPWSWSRI